jgi:hypothetical protein
MPEPNVTLDNMFDPAPDPVVAAGGAEGAEGGEAAVTPEPEPEWMADAPDEFKGILGHANLKDESKNYLKTIYGELHGFKSSPYGTPEAFQELAELFPGGIEDLRAAQQTLQDTARVQKMLESGDPDQMNEALEERLVGNPDSFIQQIQGGLDALKRSNLNQEYADIAMVLAKDRLDSASKGKYAEFNDGLVELASRYNSLAATNPDEAAKIAGQLASRALSIAEWWADAKKELGFGEKVERTNVTGRSAVVRPAASDNRELQAAQRDVESFNNRYRSEQTSVMRPMFMKALTTEMTARKITLNDYWKGKVGQEVADELARKFDSDPQLQALINREHYKGNKDDLKGYDTSDKVIRNIIAAAKTRGEKLIPKLVAQALAHIADLNPGARAADPAAGVRGGAAGAGKPKTGTLAEKLADRKVSLEDTLSAVFQ